MAKTKRSKRKIERQTPLKIGVNLDAHFNSNFCAKDFDVIFIS
jgi:hypothetical protein